MIPSSSQCDREQLRRLLDEELPPDLQDALARHLERCPDCRKELESMAAGPDWWSDAQRLLSTIVNLNEATSTDNVLSPGGMVSREVGRRLNFLSPSDDPTKLGRLGPYEIEKLIGRGGMGIVLKAFDPVLNRHVAIKVLAPQWVHSAAARHRFAREARAAAAITHEHVIAIYAVDSANETPYLVMPFIDGISLQERIESATGSASVRQDNVGTTTGKASGNHISSANGPLKLKEILRIAIQIAAGLSAAHAQGLVHRDIKPANILLENGNCPDFPGDCPNFRHENETVPLRSGKQRVLITDFGLARAVDDASFTRSCFIAGTPEYMAPEQANGEAIDHRTDLFSLGSVMYALCTGRSPFRRENTMAVLRQICEGEARPIREINSEFPVWLVRIIEKLHAKDPADRYQTAGEVESLLRQWLFHLEQPSLHPKPREPAVHWPSLAWFARRDHRARWAAALALLLAGFAVSEIMDVSHLSRLLIGGGKIQSDASPGLGTAHNATMPAPKTDTSDFYTNKETAFEKRIADLWQRLAALESSASKGETAEVSPERIGQFRAALADLQAELPEFRRDSQSERLRQIGEAIQQIKPRASSPEAGQDINASLMEISGRIEQLNQDLYRNFP
jgi:eukaryotic-like serine/threonine-protein kinase